MEIATAAPARIAGVDEKILERASAEASPAARCSSTSPT